MVTANAVTVQCETQSKQISAAATSPNYRLCLHSTQPLIPTANKYVHLQQPHCPGSGANLKLLSYLPGMEYPLCVVFKTLPGAPVFAIIVLITGLSWDRPAISAAIATLAWNECNCVVCRCHPVTVCDACRQQSCLVGTQLCLHTLLT